MYSAGPWHDAHGRQRAIGSEVIISASARDTHMYHAHDEPRLK